MRHAPLSRASLGLLCVGAAAGARPSAFRGRPATHSCVPRAAVVLSAPRPSGEGCPGGGAGEDHTSADLDMEVLRRRIRRSGGTLDSVAPYADLAACADIAEGSHLDDLAFGWVLLFAPRTDEEGVYTVQDDDETTFVLAFESHDDATRFAQQLEAEDFDLPSVAQWSMDSLTDFCEEGDFKVGLVPDGVMLMPPRQNFYRRDDIGADEEGAAAAGELDLAEFSRALSAESPLSGQRASRVSAEVIARLDDLFAADCAQRPPDEA